MTPARPQDHPAEAPPDRGERARTLLISEAARIFAEKGYAAASTREICAGAGLNVAAIHYHFGGKDDLYRAALLGPITGIVAQLRGFDAPGLSLAQSLQRLLGVFVGDDGAPAAIAQDGMRLYLREMIEPTPVFAQAVGQHIGPVHEAIAQLLARHIGVAVPDDDVHRLVFGLIAMAHDYCMSREFMKAVAPRLLDGPDALARARDRLVDWGVTLVAHERERRGLTKAQE